MRSATRHQQKLLIVLAALSVLVVACGGGLDGKPPESLTAGATDGSSSSSGSEDPKNPSGSPSKKEDRDRPGWIQSIFGSSPSARCTEPIAAGSRDTALEVQRLRQQVICIGDLNVLRTPVLTLTAPDGTRTTMLGFRESPGAAWKWELNAVFSGNLPDIGTYAFRVPSLKDNHSPPPTSLAPSASPSTTTATPGPSSTTKPSTPSTALPSEQAVRLAGTTTPGLVTSGTITVLAASSPEFAVEQAEVRAGRNVRVDLAGFHPAEDLYVSIYGPVPGRDADDAETIPLLADVPRVTADGDGEAVATWTVPPGTDTGTYAIWVDPADEHSDISGSCQQACLSFRVTN